MKIQRSFTLSVIVVAALVFTLVASAVGAGSALADHNGIHSGWQATAERNQALADYYLSKEYKVFESDGSFSRPIQAWADRNSALALYFQSR